MDDEQVNQIKASINNNCGWVAFFVLLSLIISLVAMTQIDNRVGRIEQQCIDRKP